MENKEKQTCEVVQDLLPLYLDGACSASSRQVVEEHLTVCGTCRELKKKLEDHEMEDVIAEEAKGVLARHAKKEKTAAFRAGVVIAGLLLLPVLLTLIAGMVNGADFAVFWVVLASMLLLAALFVVPLLSEKQKVSRTILGAFAALLLILFFVDRMYGGGNFLYWAVPTIFGVSIPLLPVFLCHASLPSALADKKGLLTMAWDTLWLFLTICVVCFRNQAPEDFRMGVLTALVFLPGIWLVFGIARYLPANRFCKAGGISLVCGIWIAFAQDVLDALCKKGKGLTILSADFSDWNSSAQVNANLYLIALIVGILFGVLLGGIGIFMHKKQQTSQTISEETGVRK